MSHNEVILMPIGIGLDGLQMEYLVLPKPVKIRSKRSRKIDMFKSSLNKSVNPAQRRSLKHKKIRNSREVKQQNKQMDL